MNHLRSSKRDPAGTSRPTSSDDPDSEQLAFEASFDDLYGLAYRVAYRILVRREEAEDVAQEAVARAYVHWSRIREYSHPWVSRVAGNLAIGVGRRARRLAAPLDRAGPVFDDTTVRVVDMQRALRRLSRRQREVIVLRYVSDLPEAAVAEFLGCSMGTVKQHAARGLRSLRHSLGIEGEPEEERRD